MSQVDRRRALKLFAALGAAGAVGPALAACGDSSSQVTDDPVKIGLLVPQSGPNRAIGDDLTNGFTLRLKLNGNRLGGRLAGVAFADEGETPDSATMAADKLIKQKVLAISGVASSAGLSAVTDAVQAARVPLIGSNGSPASLPDSTYVWRTSYVDGEFGSTLGRYLADRHGTSPVYAIGPDGAAARELMDAFRTAFNGPAAVTGTANARPLGTESTPAGSLDFTASLNRVRASGAVAIFCAYGGAAGVAFVKAYREAFGSGAGAPALYGPGSLTEGAMLTEAGDAARNVYTAMNYSSDLDNGANRDFYAEYRKQFGRAPTAYAMASYDAAGVLNEAIRRAGEDVTPVSLNAALAGLTMINSPRGPWRFNAGRTPRQKWYLRQVKVEGDALANRVVAELPALG